MAFQCEIKEQPAQPALVIRGRTPVQGLQQLLGRGFSAVAQYLGEMGQAPAGPPFAAYHNMDMQDLDVAVGFPVAKPLPGKGEVQASEIPGGRRATCFYTGPYDGMVPAYEALKQTIKDNGAEDTGVSYEIYLNDPQVTAPKDLQTLIVFPLKGS